MQKRISLLLKEENLTAVKLAELLDVQPSSISHLISGRNKPNFDFIAKLLRRFPSIDPDWLILGEGSMHRRVIGDAIPAAEGHAGVLPSPEKELSLPNAGLERMTAFGDAGPTKEREMHEERPVAAAKRVEKIVFFYSDRSCSVYTEENGVSFF